MISSIIPKISIQKILFLHFGSACVLEKKNIFHDLRSLFDFTSDFVNYFQVKDPYLEKLVDIIAFHKLKIPETWDTLIGAHIFEYNHDQIKDIINTIKNYL